MSYSLIDMVLYFFIYSFLGWLMETVLCSVNERRFINRGFLYGPLCPIYGCGFTLIIIFQVLVAGRIENVFAAAAVIFLSGSLLATIVEYAVSWGMEKLFKARWWDYSHYRYNINGRVAPVISLAWGALSTAVLFWVHPRIEQLVKLLYSANSRLPYIIAVILLCLLAADVIVSTFVALRIGEKLEQLEKLAELIHGYVESLTLPTREDILGKIEGLYERVFDRNKRKIYGKEKEVKPDEELHRLTFEALKNRIAAVIKDLSNKRESLMEGTRYLQRRMLRAFPRMKTKGDPSSLRDWKERIKFSKNKKS